MRLNNGTQYYQGVPIISTPVIVNINNPDEIKYIIANQCAFYIERNIDLNYTFSLNNISIRYEQLFKEEISEHLRLYGHGHTTGSEAWNQIQNNFRNLLITGTFSK